MTDSLPPQLDARGPSKQRRQRSESESRLTSQRPNQTTLDWAAIAHALGECATQPLAVLDGSGCIRLFNRAMEQALGCSRFEVEGRPWTQIFAQIERGFDMVRAIREALCGARRQLEVAAISGSGRRVFLEFECFLVGRCSEQALLLVAKRVVLGESLRDPASTSGRDLDYDVAVGGEDFGRVRRVFIRGESIPLAEAEPRCFSLIHGLAQPCEECPLREQRAQGPWPRTSIRARRLQSAAGHKLHFEVTTAEPLDAATVRFRLRTISEHTLGAIQEARLKRIAKDTNLSAREQDVLRYLLMGRRTEDIAKVLRISQRTVKYHQANVLEKLGADSRLDLMRLLF